MITPSEAEWLRRSCGICIFATIAAKMALVELPERCLYSSDAPYGEPYLYRQLIEFASPDQTTAKMALGENMGKLLRNLGLVS